MRLDALALAILLGALLAWKFRADHRRERARRAGLLDAVAACLPGAERALDAAGFPRLTVPLPDGHRVELALLPDTAAYRRLPCLWLTVTLPAPIAQAPRLDLLARAHNVEFYSPAEELPLRIDLPDDWPPGLQVKTDRAGLDLTPLREPAAAFFAEPYAKELMLAPGGVRLVVQFAQARRSEYLVLRSAVFEPVAQDAGWVQRLVGRAVEVREAWLAGQPALKDAA